VYTIDGSVGLCFALGYLYAGIKLPAILAAGGSLLVRLLVASMVYRGLGLLTVAMNGGTTTDFAGPIVGIAIGLYLLGNVRRLVSEAGHVPREG
jgi:hypothetical protein